MIYAQLKLNTICRQGSRTTHDARIIYKDVKLGLLTFVGSHEMADGFLGGKIALSAIDVRILGFQNYFFAGLFTFLQVPACHINRGIPLSKFSYRFLPYPCIGTSHDDYFAGFISLFGESAALHKVFYATSCTHRGASDTQPENSSTS